jgi:cell wall-associated NlpC family hydrolase
VNEYLRRALACVGTPFQHQGRLLDVGLDCVGLVVQVYQCAEMDRRDYHEVPTPEHSKFLRQLLDCSFVREPVDFADSAREGSILAFAFGTRRQIRHLAIRSGVGMVHAIKRGVVEDVLAEPWLSRFEGAYTWRK